MKFFLLLLLVFNLFACLKLDENIHSYTENKQIFAHKNNFSLEIKIGQKTKFSLDEKVEFDIHMQDEMSIKNLKNILFIKSVSKPNLNINFSIKKIADSNMLKIKFKKLSPDFYDFYYIYNNQKKILLSFKVMQPQPKMLSHNLLMDAQKIGANIKQNIFIFKFDKNIQSTNNTQIVINNKFIVYPEKIIINNNILTIFSENIFDNKFLNIGDKFMFEIVNLKTLDDEIASFENLHIKLIEPQADLLSYSDIITKISHNSARFYMQFNNLVESQICIFKNNNKECLGQVIYNDCQYDTIAFCQVHVTHLEKNTTYNFSISSIDYQSDKKNFVGTFTTLKPQILLKEVMIRPDMQDNKKQTEGEFIKITNIGEDIFIDNLFINIFSKNNLTKFNNFTVSVNKMIKKDEDLFIAGKNFDPSLYKTNNFVITDKVSLGMNDKEEKIITIFKDSYEYFDEYHGFLWSGAKGHSIIRKDLNGIDEENNYSYLAY